MAELERTGTHGRGPRGVAGPDRVQSWYWLLIAVLTLAGALLPGAPRAVIWGLAGLVCVVAIFAGPAINRLDTRRAWRMLGYAALLLLATSYDLLTDTVVRGESTVPSTFDFVILVGYPLAAVAVLFIAMRNSPMAIWARLLDALIVLTSLSLFTWTQLVVPLAGASLPSTSVRAIAITYALGDAFILVVLSRLLYPTPLRRPAAVWLLVGGTALMLASDIVFSLVQLGAVQVTGRSVAGTVQGAVWLVGLCAWGGAVLSPTASAIEQPLTTEQSVPALRSALVMGGAVLAMPIVGVLDQARDIGGNSVTLVVFGSIISALLVVRLTLTLAQENRRVRDERDLSKASARLVAASEPGEILSTVLDAAELLTAGGDEPQVAVAALDGGSMLAATSDERDGAAPHTVAGASPASWVARHFGARRHVLVSPPPAGHQQPGLALGVSNDRARLGEQVNILQILVSQGAQAVSRLGLSREVSRREGEAYFRALVENASDAIVIIEQSGRVRYASPSAAELFGAADPTAADLAELFGAQNAASVTRALAEPVGRGGSNGTEHWDLDRTGAGRRELEVVREDLRANPAVRGVVLTARDVTTERRLERDLRYHAYYDTLTGLGNRLKFHRRAELELARASADGPVPTVLLLDIDDFRELNEMHGRDIGDVILIGLARRLSDTATHLEAARFDSDTFAVLRLTEDGSAEACEAAADELAALASEPFDLPVGQIALTTSVGVATAKDERHSEELVRDARLALESARSPGHNSWRRFEPSMLELRLEHARMHRDLETAIEEGAFVLHYQPVVDLVTGGISSFEALVRWPHPSWGLVPPDKFVPIAEETGLIVPLGRWILDRAMRDAKRLRAVEGAGATRIGINVSARQFAVPGLAVDVAAALEQSGLPPGAVIVELTESALMGREDGGTASLNALRDLGVLLAIDDFGTGFSSLSYLHKLPFNALKIDKSFVDEIETSHLRAQLIHGIVGIADTLGLSVIAEGVESERQRVLLAEAGCKYGQGFLFSRAMPLDDAIEYLRSVGSTQSGMR